MHKKISLACSSMLLKILKYALKICSQRKYIEYAKICFLKKIYNIYNIINIVLMPKIYQNMLFKVKA